MALAATPVKQASTTWGNKRVRVLNLAFSGDYPTGGEALNASSCGLKVIEQVICHGNAAETDLTGSWITKVKYTAPGQVHIVLFESAGAGAVPTQKPAEAYESAGELRVTVVGY